MIATCIILVDIIILYHSITLPPRTAPSSAPEPPLANPRTTPSTPSVITRLVRNQRHRHHLDRHVGRPRRPRLEIGDLRGDDRRHGPVNRDARRERADLGVLPCRRCAIRDGHALGVVDAKTVRPGRGYAYGGRTCFQCSCSRTPRGTGSGRCRFGRRLDGSVCVCGGRASSLTLPVQHLGGLGVGWPGRRGHCGRGSPALAHDGPGEEGDEEYWPDHCVVC
jgi:hypothetical protein